MRLAARLALVFALAASSASLGAVPLGRGLPMGGAVVDVTGRPVAGVLVVLSRVATTSTGGENHRLVAHAKTDAAGNFTFGTVNMEPEVAFPVETGVSFDYSVMPPVGNIPRRLVSKSFNAPRSQPDLQIQLVDVKIVVQ